MHITKLPDPALRTNNLSTEISNTVIYAGSTSTYHYPKHQTPYLFLANFKSTGTYHLNDRPISINDRFFYFLNSGDQLEINFEKKLALETLIILFNPSLIEEALNYHNQSADELLSMGNSRSVYTLQIPAIPFTYTESIRQNIAKILNTAFREEMESENSYFDLVEEFLNLSNTSRDDLSKLNVKKKSTREELYRRIFLARIFMQDNLRLPLTVGQIAKEACLNKFHFLKLFKKYYGITPYQHLIDIKMERAHDLLKSGKFSAGEVCLMIGFESQGSFTNLFKKYYGLPPSKFKRSA